MEKALFIVARQARYLYLLLAFLLLAGLGWLAWSFTRSPAAPSAVTSTPAPSAWPEPQRFSADAWRVFQRRPNQAAPAEGPLGRRFRLAGTFFAFGTPSDSTGEGNRSAILDDLNKQTQHLVREGDTVESCQVVSIHSDRVILRSGSREEELWLSFSGPAGHDETGKPRAGGAPPAEQVLEVSRFGKRVGEKRWVLSQESLMGYYHELLDDPERLASLYLSMKPDYLEDKVDGFYVDMEGEQEFFQALGLENGTVIRRVNSMKMTSQMRAEYFIKEFVKGRLSAVVLDVEREGTPDKLIYLFR